MTTTLCVKSGKNVKTCYANLLKKFEERQLISPHDIILPHAAVSFIKDDHVDLEVNKRISVKCDTGRKVKPQPVERKKKTLTARTS